MKILSFVGTRPELIKTLAFCRAVKKFSDVEFQVVHTFQNFLPEMTQEISNELGISLHDQSPAWERSSPGSIAKSLIDYCSACLSKYQPDVVISNTDTDTAFYSALAAVKHRIPVAHIEGGIRSSARTNPEDVNRRLADHLSNWVFTIDDYDSENLLSEGFSRDQVFMLGDITLDALNIVLCEHGIPVTRGEYHLFTMHRQENAGDPVRLKAILEAVDQAGVRTVFPIHPRTRTTLEENGLMEIIDRSSVIEPTQPLGYLEMVGVLAGCNKVISDSGGLRREGYMLGKPVISLVSFVWFRRMNELGFEFVADADPSKILHAIREYDPHGPRPPIFGDGRAAEHILGTLRDKIG